LCVATRPYRRIIDDHRKAARPLRRYARAGGFAVPSYTITGDTTSSHGLAGVELTKLPLNALTSNQSNCNARFRARGFGPVLPTTKEAAH
jgi:hypothetical protein